jgi:hypothetical protein
MREFTKSILSYSWATSVFGVQQMINLITPQGSRPQHPATEAFNNATKCTADEFGDAMRATCRLGDNLQRGMVDVLFSVATLGVFDWGGSRGRGGGTGCGSNIGEQTTGAVRQGMSALGQAADVIGQAVGGATSGWSTCGRGTSRSEPTGWGPVPPAQSSSK